MVACSSLGGFSIAYCQECLLNNCEPKGYIKDAVELNGGWDKTQGWVKGLMYFENGVYHRADTIKVKSWSLENEQRRDSET